MRRLSYQIAPCGRMFIAIRRTEWPDHDQRVYGPLHTRLGTYETVREARNACLNDASWHELGAWDAGHNIEIDSGGLRE